VSTAGQAFPHVDTLDGKSHAHVTLALFAGDLLFFCLFRKYFFPAAFEIEFLARKRY
jgi:hypothetical protein